MQLILYDGEFYSDTISSKIKSVSGYTPVQKRNGNKSGYIKSYPMEGHYNHNLGDSLSLIIQDAVIMQKLYTYNAPKMVFLTTILGAL